MSNWQMWLDKNYKILSMWSKRWSPNDWRELMAFMSLYLEKNWTKFSAIPDGEQRIKFLQVWMKNNVKWDNSDFNKSISVNNFGEEFTIEDESVEEDFDTIAEDIPLDIREWILDLRSKFSEIEVRRLVLIRTIYLNLKPHEKALYNLYFTEMLSLRQISFKLDIPLSSVYGMLKDLKTKIKEKCQ
jgi:hypothetical protein